jgi:arginyl-tRNA--protein-N-Asp/Glu arginylyltransferase
LTRDVTAPFRFPRFFVTTPSPCPYLPGRHERKVFTDLTGSNAVELNDALGRIGFRRSQNVAYRPSCLNCSACVSVRVCTQEFVPSASQKRLLKRNSDLIVEARAPWATEEQYELLSHYLNARHPDGGMADMSESDYAAMVEQSSVETCVVEYREPDEHGRPGRLVGACLTDRQADGLSMVYSFFLPDDDSRKGLGTFIILDHIVRAARAGLPFVYLGYWIDGSDRMAYKAKFQPLEMLRPDGWVRMGAPAPAPDAVLPEPDDAARFVASLMYG